MEKNTSLVNILSNKIIDLYFRWQDKKKDEDFKAYEEEMKSRVENISNITFIEATKRPFGFFFELQGVQYYYSIKKRGNLATPSIRKK